jgi:hypothetical protein
MSAPHTESPWYVGTPAPTSHRDRRHGMPPYDSVGSLWRCSAGHDRHKHTDKPKGTVPGKHFVEALALNLASDH